tara:strand:- start:79 stop:306 length:228 start_codon:yes stop_codon:yes gene_type:complete
MAQLKKVIQKFQDPAYVGKENTTGTARLLHVNEVIDWVRDAAKLEYTSNADAKTAGLVVGDLYHTAGVLKIVYNA